MTGAVFAKLLAIIVTVALGWLAGRMRWLGDAQADPARKTGHGQPGQHIGVGGDQRQVPHQGPARRIEREVPADLPVISAGDTIRHKSFGEGIVISVPTAEEIIVRFPTSGERRLHVAYAPIELA